MVSSSPPKGKQLWYSWHLSVSSGILSQRQKLQLWECCIVMNFTDDSIYIFFLALIHCVTAFWLLFLLKLKRNEMELSYSTLISEQYPCNTQHIWGLVTHLCTTIIIIILLLFINIIIITLYTADRGREAWWKTYKKRGPFPLLTSHGLVEARWIVAGNQPEYSVNTALQ